MNFDLRPGCRQVSLLRNSGVGGGARKLSVVLVLLRSFWRLFNERPRTHPPKSRHRVSVCSFFFPSPHEAVVWPSVTFAKNMRFQTWMSCSLLKCLILMAASVVKNPSMIRVTLLCGQVLSGRAGPSAGCSYLWRPTKGLWISLVPPPPPPKMREIGTVWQIGVSTARKNFKAEREREQNPCEPAIWIKLINNDWPWKCGKTLRTDLQIENRRKTKRNDKTQGFCGAWLGNMWLETSSTVHRRAKSRWDALSGDRGHVALWKFMGGSAAKRNCKPPGWIY